MHVSGSMVATGNRVGESPRTILFQVKEFSFEDPISRSSGDRTKNRRETGMESKGRSFQDLSNGGIRAALLLTVRETESVENGANDARRTFGQKGRTLTVSGGRTVARSGTGLPLTGRSRQELSDGENRVALSSTVRKREAVENIASDGSKKSSREKDETGSDCGGTGWRRNSKLGR